MLPTLQPTAKAAPCNFDARDSANIHHAMQFRFALFGVKLMRFSVRHLASLKNVKATLQNARVLALAIGFSACSPAIAQEEACRANLNLLGQDLISMLRKIPAMPPITQIYTPVRRLYEEAKYARSRGDFESCIKKTNLALKYSKPYGRRY